ncbi:MAG: hypothetical protein LIP08_02225, partial [Bacteroides sp.]|nr:hypothetical protein [Bacteroides sp.]
MPERAIHQIQQEKETLRSYAHSVGSGWDDQVKERFYRGHLDEIYSSTDSFQASALTGVERIKQKEGQIQQLWN